MTMEATCAQCGCVHVQSELELSFRRPDAIAGMSDEERRKGAKETEDLCAIWPDRFFIRGVLPLPVAGWQNPYRIGIWVEVERSVFDRVRQLWDEPDQAEEPAFVVRLGNAIPSLPATLGLDALLRLTGPNTRPDILIPESGHPLHQEQCLGISAHRAEEYNVYFRAGRSTSSSD